MITWSIEDHICRDCGGRILRSVTGAGMTPGGNSIYQCADCGKKAHKANDVCWCGYMQRSNNMRPYRCFNFSIIDKFPKMKEEL